MSVFDDDNDDVKESIRFFNRLPDADKVRVLSDLNPFIFQQKQEYQPLFPLLSKLQQDISKHHAITLGKKLMELGLDETHAHLFVLNVKKHAPTEEYQMKQLDMIPDDDFCAKLPNIMNDVWVNNETPEVLSEKYGIDNEKISCIVSLTLHAFNGLSRGLTTKSQLEQNYKNSVSKRKVDVLINQISVHSKHQYDTVLFSNAQDVFSNTRQILQQNREILEMLKELVDLRKEEMEKKR